MSQAAILTQPLDTLRPPVTKPAGLPAAQGLSPASAARMDSKLGYQAEIGPAQHVLAAAHETLFALATSRLLDGIQLQDHQRFRECIRMLLAGAAPTSVVVVFLNIAGRVVATERRTAVVDNSAAANLGASLANHAVVRGACHVLTAQRWSPGHSLELHAQLAAIRDMALGLKASGSNLVDHLVLLGEDVVSGRDLDLL